MINKNTIKFPCIICPGREHSMFKYLTEPDIKTISQNKTAIKYKKGQTLFHENTKPIGLFCINSGKVKVYKVNHEGREQILKLAKPGDFLGFRALISNEFYNSSATVIEEGIICYIPQADFIQVLHSNFEFFKLMAGKMAHELGKTEKRLMSLAQKTVRERLAATLLMLKDNYGVDGVEKGLINIALSREDLANIIGTATESVIRLLSDFKSQQLISFQGKKIIILDTEGLIREADFQN